MKAPTHLGRRRHYPRRAHPPCGGGTTRRRCKRRKSLTDGANAERILRTVVAPLAGTAEMKFGHGEKEEKTTEFAMRCRGVGA